MEPIVLPKDLMEVQLGEVDLLMAMYASDDEIIIDDTSRQLLDSLRNWCESDDGTTPETSETSVFLLLSLGLPSPSGDSARLQLGITVPVVCEEGGTIRDEPPKTKVRVRQPAWMSKTEAARLTDEIANDDLLTAIENVKESAVQYLSESSQQRDSSATIVTSVVRVWFYFPSISTRSKRDDIVNHAPGYGLTGFLLAGKPGILCLEGGSQAIDDYMKFIKTESWNDIPSQHKKVSERYREEGPDLPRAFEDMREITDEFGETRRGARGNRNDMSVFKAWLVGYGVSDAFEKVFI